jgi:hypothetical protein
MLGVSDEENLVIELNKKENHDLWNIFGLDSSSHVAIHVKEKKVSKFHDKKISPKADIFIAKGNVPREYLDENKYLITEKDFEKLNLAVVKYSGISVKKYDSKSYTITKISPTPFKNIFGSYELGCGVSVFVKKESEINLNESILFSGWKTNIDSMINYFRPYVKNIENLKQDIDVSEKKEIYSNIKSEAIAIMTNLIDSNKSLNDFIFKGIGAFDEPFTAHYFYQNNNLSKDCYIPYSITTGSGRNKGIFTVVIKPKH